jgi:hypothetical protein
VNTDESQPDELADILTLGEAAALCGLSPHTLSQQAEKGKLRGRKVGHTWITTRRCLAIYLEQHARRKAMVQGVGEHNEVSPALVKRARSIDPDAAELPLETLTDEQILAGCDAQFPADQQAELSDLLADQREGRITPKARVRLDQLLALYEQGLLTKARALQEAVARGLQPPISQY